MNTDKNIMLSPVIKQNKKNDHLAMVIFWFTFLISISVSCDFFDQLSVLPVCREPEIILGQASWKLKPLILNCPAR